MKQQQNFLSGEVILGFLLPPILGVPFLFFNYIKNKKRHVLIAFLMVYTLLTLYCFPYYDPNIFFFSAISDNISFQGHALNGVANVFRQLFHIDVYFSFGIYFFFSIFFYFKSLDYYSGYKRKNLLFIIAILSMPIDAWTNTFYIPLALSFFLFWGEKYKKSIKLLVLGAYISSIIHTVAFLIIFPAIIIYLLARKEKYILFYSFIVIYLIVMWFFFHGYAESFFVLLGDNELVINKIQMYTDIEGVWGGVGLKKGPIGRIVQTLSYCLFAYNLILISLNRSKMKSYFVTYLYIIGCINILCSFHLFTFNQRFCIVNIMFSVAISFILYQSNKAIIYKSIFVFTLLLSYVLPFLHYHGSMKHDLFDSEESYYNISTQVFYTPSVLLVANFSNKGWNDTYMCQHAIWGQNIYFNPNKRLKYLW